MFQFYCSFIYIHIEVLRQILFLHIVHFQVVKEGSVGAIFVFSFTDRSSFEEIDHQLSRVAHPNSNICPIVIGMK